MIWYCMKLYRPDGRKYEGTWLKGKQHGKGLYTNKNGMTVESEWNQGKRVESFIEKNDE